MHLLVLCRLHLSIRVDLKEMVLSTANPTKFKAKHKAKRKACESKQHFFGLFLF